MIGSQLHSSIEQIVEKFVREELSQENAHIAGAIWNMLDAGGKKLRPRIVKLAGLACDEGVAQDAVLASYMELIHIATLIHDDVLDGADLRRGRSSTNRMYGNRFSVLAGDYLFSWVFKKVTQSYPNPVPTILAAMLSDICNGEVKQLRASGDPTVSKERYLEIIGKKTAELFAACAECGAITALQNKDASPGSDMRDLAAVRALRAFGWSYGMAFQIRDDLLDLTASDAALGKPAGSDLREKKVTLPLIYALQNDDGRTRALVDTLFGLEEAASAQTAPLLDELVGRVRSSFAIDRSIQTMAGFVSQAQSALTPLRASGAREELAVLAKDLMQFSR